mgnify:CR=1 FL=1
MQNTVPTIKDVARIANVSITTVSHTINGTRKVSEELRTRVYEAMDVLGYQQNSLARGLRLGETRTIGIIIPDNSNPFFADIARYIENAGFENGYSAILCNSDDLPEKELTYIQVLIEKQVDGIIFITAGKNSRSIERLQKSRIPVVIVDRHFEAASMDEVYVDNYRGAFEATKHLIALGHRRIGLVSGPSVTDTSSSRFAGYRDALSQFGIPFDETMIYAGNFRPESGRQGVRQLMKSSNLPTAIFCLNDMMAVAAINELQKMDLQVPQDVSVIGYDDVGILSELAENLTTVHQPIDQMATIASRMVIERIQNKETTFEKKVEILQPSLIIRSSTGKRRRHEINPVP